MSYEIGATIWARSIADKGKPVVWLDQPDLQRSIGVYRQPDGTLIAEVSSILHIIDICPSFATATTVLAEDEVEVLISWVRSHRYQGVIY